MNKNIRAKLSKLDSQKLIEIIDLLCDDRDSRRRLSFLVNASPADIDHALNELDVYCEMYRICPDNDSVLKKLLVAIDRLFAAAGYLNAASASAEIFYGIIMAYRANQLDELWDETVNDCLFRAVDELTELLQNEERTFPAEAEKKYKNAVDFYNG